MSTKPCTLTVESFLAAATPLALSVNGATVEAMPRRNESGSFGYYANGKVNCDVDAPSCTLSINGVEVTAYARGFDSGSTGYYFNGKAPAIVDGQSVMLQVGLRAIFVDSKKGKARPVLQVGGSITVIGSKPQA
jgi:hypothetical protein